MEAFRKFVLVALCLAAAMAARAQLDITLSLPSATVMRFERIPAVVTLKNNTGNRIVCGAGGYAMHFDVKTLDGNPVPPGVLPIQAPVVEPGAELSFTNDLTRVTDLASVMQVSVAARADLGGTSFVSKKLFLDVMDGVEIARIRTSDSKEGGMIHQLRIMNRDGHEHVFVRVDSEKGGWSFGSRDLGTIIRATPPAMMVGKDGVVHILHRSGPSRFIYHQVQPTGQITKGEAFDGDYQSVRMTTDAEGSIRVIGMPASSSDSLPILRQSPFRPDLHR